MASCFYASPTFIAIPKFRKPSTVPLAVSVSSRRRSHGSSTAVIRPRAQCGTNEDSLPVNSLAVRTTAPSLAALARSTSRQTEDLEPFGSDSDTLDAINKEIRVTEEGHVNKMTRDEFHFKIYEEETSEFITLRRFFRNETIEVQVYLQEIDDDPQKFQDVDVDAQEQEVNKTNTSISSSLGSTSTTCSSEDQEEEIKIKKVGVKYEEEEEENAEDLHMEQKTKLAFTVTVKKGEGNRLIFFCIGDEDDFTIEDMYLDVTHDKQQEGEDDGSADEGYMFNDLSWDLQKEFYKYLEKRGISPSTLGFLQDYMLNKERCGYLEWLHNMKRFIEN